MSTILNNPIEDGIDKGNKIPDNNSDLKYHLNVINNIENNTTCKIYPSPTYGIINIDFPQFTDVLSIEIFDFTGKKIQTYTGNNILTISFDLSANEKGIYIVKILTNKNDKTFKISKI